MIKRFAFNFVMKTIDQIRLENLARLVAEIGTQDKVAELAQTSPIYLSQIINRAKDSKTGKVRQIGDDLARKLEVGCGKETGWMDNTATYAQLHGENDLRAMAVAAMEDMGPAEMYQVLRMLDVLKKPPAGNGTNH